MIRYGIDWGMANSVLYITLWDKMEGRTKHIRSSILLLEYEFFASQLK